MTFVEPTLEEFTEAIGAEESDSNAAMALDVAVSVLDDYLESAYREVPQVVYSFAVMRIGHHLYKQMDSPQGSTQFATDVGVTTTSMGRDALIQVYPILKKYVLPF